VIADTKRQILASTKRRKHTATEPVAKIPSKKRENATGKEKGPKKIGTKPHLREIVLPTGKIQTPEQPRKIALTETFPRFTKGENLAALSQEKKSPQRKQAGAVTSQSPSCGETTGGTWRCKQSAK
jgi:hypothetical protein